MSGDVRDLLSGERIVDANGLPSSHFVEIMQRLTTAVRTGSGGTSGTGIPAGGLEGEVLTKQSDANGDADWEPIILVGGGAAI